MLKSLLRLPYNRFQKLYNKQIDGIGLEVFRILFFLCLFGDIITLMKYYPLIFDEVPYLVPYEFTLWPALVLWMASVISIIIGFKTRIALIFNYLFCVVFIANIHTYEYHMYYVQVSMSFVAMFVPLGRSLSVDRWLLGKQGLNTTVPRTSSAFNYALLIFAGIGLTYFDSIFHKYVANVWLSGLGVWLPSSIPHIVVADFTPLLNQKYLMIFLGYFTLIFETVFIFLFWFKRMRIPFLFIGLGLHLGITMVYPIPYFGLGMSAIYMLFVPVSFWRKIARKMGIEVEVNLPEPGTNPMPFLSKEKRVRLAWFGIVALSLCQGAFIYYSPAMFSLKKRVPMVFKVSDPILKPLVKPTRYLAPKFMGLHQHGVFVDGHFDGYDHNISIRHVENGETTLLPISQESGLVGPMQTAPTWAKWGFRVNAPVVDSLRFVEGVRDFTLYWMHDNALKFDGQSFDLILKRVEAPNGWSKDFLRNQLQAPWQKFGAVRWENNEMIIEYIDFDAIYAKN